MLPDTKKAFEWNGSLPQVQRVRLDFPRPRILDIPAAINQAVESLGDHLPDLQGCRVAVTAGSRGISQMPAVLSALITYLHRLGANPFIVPAMGSHAGATAEGQKTMLAELGITEESTGAPVLSSMQTLELGRLENGMPVYMDRLVAGADAIVIVNRVKPHTDFSGRLESGLAKMTAVGLGKLDGAAALHRYGVHGLRDLMPQAARLACQKAPVVFGLATIENAYHEVAHMRALPGGEIGGPQEEALLKLAYSLMPRFPFPEVDVLVVEQMGKNISGVGMDPKVIGRVKVQGVPDLAPCVIHSLVVLRLTAETHGNATGVGLADVTTRALLAQIDFDTTYLNCITSGITGIQRAALPLVAPSDRAAVETALRACGRPDIENARLVRIQDTLSLGEMDLSPGLLAEADASVPLTPVSEPYHLPFDDQGNLLPFAQPLTR